MTELVSSYGLIAPEIVLVCGAMALLMLGVFRPENDREAETIGWLAILVIGLATWLDEDTHYIVREEIGEEDVAGSAFILEPWVEAA
jgi:NADH:ubiquinone oxidoreductase subunit 2 (subunit N)